MGIEKLSLADPDPANDNAEKIPEGIDDLTSALAFVDKDSANPKAYRLLAEAYWKRDDFKGARETLERALRLDLTDSNEWFDLAFFCQNCGFDEEGEKCIEKAIDSLKTVTSW